MALRDFEHAIQLDPATGDFYSGRGSALVAMGNYREAVSDAEESLRRSESEPRLYYSAARILAQAADHANTERRPRNSSRPTQAQSYQDRALALLGQAVERTHPAERAAFWRNVVDSDRVFTAIRRLPAYARIAAAAGAHPDH
jgi:tetratricopeptide (TPR) repeat protein